MNTNFITWWMLTTSQQYVYAFSRLRTTGVHDKLVNDCRAIQFEMGVFFRPCVRCWISLKIHYPLSLQRVINFFRVFSLPIQPTMSVRGDINGLVCSDISRVRRARVTHWSVYTLAKQTDVSDREWQTCPYVGKAKDIRRVLPNHFQNRNRGWENRGRRWLPQNYRTVRGHRPTGDGGHSIVFGPAGRPTWPGLNSSARLSFPESQTPLPPPSPPVDGFYQCFWNPIPDGLLRIKSRSNPRNSADYVGYFKTLSVLRKTYRRVVGSRL